MLNLNDKQYIEVTLAAANIANAANPHPHSSDQSHAPSHNIDVAEF